MRQIDLKTVQITLHAQPGAPPLPFSYAEAIAGVVNAHAAQSGLPLSEIEKCLRILGPLGRAVDACESVLLLEDADWLHLNTMVSEFAGWRLVHQVVPDFVQDIARAVVLERGTVVMPPVVAQPVVPANTPRSKRR